MNQILPNTSDKQQNKLKYQVEFLERLGRRFSSRGELVRLMGETLNVGRDAVYRRLRGETVLGADEMMLLSREFDVRIVEERATHDFPLMVYPNTSQQTKSDVEYFARLRQYTSGIVKLPGVRVDYASSELPLFYELSTPTLRAFKVYIYSLSCWNLPKWRNQPFQRSLVSPETHTLAQDILNDAFQITGRELWSVNILTTVLRQIVFVVETGQFASDVELKDLFAELHSIVEHLELMVRLGKRFPLGEQPTADSPDLRVYHNELSNTNNAIIVRSEEQNFMFTTLNNPNYLISYDHRLITEVSTWFDNLSNRGNALNAIAGKYVTRYFAQLRRQIDLAEERINSGKTIF